MNTLAEFQEDMRRGYLWGATGVMTSGLALPPHVSALVGAGTALAFGAVLLAVKQRAA